MTRPRFAVIGCGSIGKRHTRNLLALGEKDIVAFDPRAERRDEAAALGVSVLSSLEAVLDLDPHAVVVASPTKVHVEHALAAAQRGCHLFIEKPISDEHDPALDRLVDVVREKRLVSLVGCNLRFHPGLQLVKRMLEESRVGTVVTARAEFGHYLPSWHPSEDYRQGYSARRDLGGGVILDAIHELDYLRWLMGEIASVAALAGHLSHIEIDTEDTASILLRFANGSFGEVHLDYVQRAYTRSCEVIGDQGTIAWEFTRSEVRLFSAASQVWEVYPGAAGWTTNQMYLDEMRHFRACIAGEEQTQQDVSEAARVLDIALAAKASAERSAFVTPRPAAAAL